MVHLVTGYAGNEHILSEDDGSFNAAFIGSGQYVMEIGNQLAAQIINNNTVRILDGDGLMYGRHFRIKQNAYEDIAIETGSSGVNRIDLICMRYEKTASDGIESVGLQVIKGTPTSGTAAVPVYTNGNILTGANVNEMPLYKVEINGVVLSKVTAVFETIPTYRTQANRFKQQIDEIIEDFQRTMFDSMYPVGSIYMSVSNVNPTTLFGGTWVAWGAGKVPVGVNASETEFNSAEKTGGAKTHTLTSEQLPSHNHTFTPSGSLSSSGAHTHTVSGNAASAGAHTHNINAKYDRWLDPGSGDKPLFHSQGGTTAVSQVFSAVSNGAHTHTISGNAASNGAHGHTFSGTQGTTTSTGSGSAHNNLQPYITCYMWKRTA